MKNLSTLPDLRPGRMSDDEIDALPEPTRFGQLWVWPNGLTIPVVCGGDDDDDPNDPGGDGGGDGDGDDDDKPKFTQKAANAIGAAEKNKGARAERKRLMESLGVKDEAELKAKLDAAKAREDKESSEADKAKREADEREARAADKEKAATEKAKTADVKSALVDAGVKDAKARSRIATLVLVELAEDDDPDEDAITAAVEAVKADMPSLFGESDGEDEIDPATGKPKAKTTRPIKKAVSGDPGSGPRKKGGDTQTGLERGAERARMQGLSRPKADATA